MTLWPSDLAIAKGQREGQPLTLRGRKVPIEGEDTVGKRSKILELLYFLVLKAVHKNTQPCSLLFQ